MVNKSFNSIMRMNKELSLLLVIAICFTFMTASRAAAKEVPEEVYTGTDNASVILNNINYNDVRNSNTWAKEAIYETGALGIMKGYGDRQFGLKIPVSKEQAIAIAYRAAGREADAQIAAEALDNARQADEKKKNAVSMWSDGYLQLAANEGLITPQELSDAFNTDQTSLTPGTSFYRAAAAQRQDIAVWLAKALKLNPVYGQNKIFNNYTDWKNADPIKIPYIEAVLQNNIMNGNGAGSFDPTGNVTREQAAQIIKNAQKFLLPVMKYEKKTGTVEDITNSADYSQGEGVSINTINVRNSNGKLHNINVLYPADTSVESRNELRGNALPQANRELIVYKNGNAGKSGLLNKGDKIEYIVDSDKNVRFVNVVPGKNNTKYIAAQINSVDLANLTIDVTQLLNLDDARMNSEEFRNLLSNDKGLINANYRLSNNSEVFKDGRKTTVDQIKPGMTVILTVNNGVITAVKVADLTLNGEDRIVKGIVEENNPQLGYITLYGDDYLAGDPVTKSILRTFNYINPNNIAVYKNYKDAAIEDVEAGDSVFIKLDDKLNVSEISAADNYTSKYAKVISKRPAGIAVEYDDGTQQVLAVDGSIPVVSDNKVVSFEKIGDGDRIKLLLNNTGKLVKVKGITIESNQHLIKGLYKGKVAYADNVSNKLVIQSMEKLDKGQWVRADQVGFTKINLAPNCKIYSGDTPTDIAGINKLLKNKDAYIASEEDYGKDEKAVVVSFRDDNDTENMIDDSISGAQTGSNLFGLSKYNQSIKYGQGTIVIKDNKLVSGSSIADEDMAYIVANRDMDDGVYNAGIVQISERLDNERIALYRGRIKQINENKDFTVESYSQLKGTNWEYSNTPKTFKITYDTRILGDSGLVAQRDFIGYGDSSYIDRSVYVVADGINAQVISTAPFGPDGLHIKGEVYDVSGGSTGSDGEVLEEPSTIKLRNAKTYDDTDHIWTDSEDITLNILQNSIILKAGKVIKPSDISNGDTLKVYKKGAENTGDAYIIKVEE